MTVLISLGTWERDIDSALSTYAATTAAGLATAMASVTAAGLTIYFMFLAYGIVRGEVQEPIGKITKDIFGMALIATIAFGAGIYQKQVMGGVQGFQGLLIGAVTQSDAQSVGDTVDKLFSITTTINGEKVPLLSALWVLAINDTTLGIPNLSYAISAALVWTASILICICCILPAMLAKIGLYLMFAIGPLFISLAIIPYTKNYFASWLSALLGNMMTSVLVSMICVFSVNVYSNAVNKVLIEGNLTESSSLALGINIIIISAVLGIASLHVSQMASQLAGGGVALDSKGLAGTLIQSRLLKNKNKTAEDKTNQLSKG